LKDIASGAKQRSFTTYRLSRPECSTFAADGALPNMFSALHELMTLIHKLTFTFQGDLIEIKIVATLDRKNGGKV
jgi:hypothetical protein